MCKSEKLETELIRIGKLEIEKQNSRVGDRVGSRGLIKQRGFT